MNKKKICIITGSRAEYGLFYPIITKINTSERLELQLITTSSHHSSEYGNTFNEIENDGFYIDIKIDNLVVGNSKTSATKSIGCLITKLADSLDQLNPDIVLLLGDRYETLGSAAAALIMNIPIAHIHGGEITEGAVDEQIRHSITKMSYLHFCSTETYQKRIVQMGEDSKRVFVTGAPGIDNIVNLKLLSRVNLEKEIHWSLSSKFALFTYHPVTLNESDLSADLSFVLNVLSNFDFNVIFTYANADPGSSIINNQIEKFCTKNPKKYKVFKNLGQTKYLSAMKHADLIIGNSSSGIIEAASFKKPVVNIGDRQKGRVKGKNIIDCSFNSLKGSIDLALSKKFRNKIKDLKNIYGDGCASEIILDKLNNEPISIIKKFSDLQKNMEIASE